VGDSGACSHLLRMNRSQQNKSKSVERWNIVGPYVPYGLFQNTREMCAKFGSDRFRNVDLYKFHTNKHSSLYVNSRGTRCCPGWPMVKPVINFVYYITKKGDVINCVNVSEWNMRHVTYERVENLRKSTHVREEEGNIMNEYNVFFDN